MKVNWLEENVRHSLVSRGQVRETKKSHLFADRQDPVMKLHVVRERDAVSCPTR
jgi:hypothetical protein